jgi:ABC-type antimicrobial peptide transport system permease subunit
MTMFVGLVPGVAPEYTFTQYVVRASHPEAYASLLGQTLASEAPGRLSFTRLWNDDIGLTALQDSYDFIAAIFIFLAILGLLLVLLGVNGITAQTAQQRQREFGIRLALGAEKRDIIRLVLHEGLLTALLGLCVGLVATSFTTKFVEKFLYGLDAEVPLLMAGGLLVLFGATVCAGIGPAIRAANADPVETLRRE